MSRSQVITIIDADDEKPAKQKETSMLPVETEPFDSDTDDGIQFEDAPHEETPSRTTPRLYHHHRQHHRHHQPDEESFIIWFLFSVTVHIWLL